MTTDITPRMRYRKTASTHHLTPPLFTMYVAFMAKTRPNAPDQVANDWANAFKTGRVWNRLTHDDQHTLLNIMANHNLIDPGLLNLNPDKTF